MINYKIAIQNPYRYKEIPSANTLRKWAKLVLKQYKPDSAVEICIRITNEIESAELNHLYRKRANPTNILSFPYEISASQDAYLGDIILCAPLISAEASEQDKPIIAHWAHLIFHGVLHLLGFDHVTEDEAQQMEQIEIQLLTNLGYRNPYGDD